MAPIVFFDYDCAMKPKTRHHLYAVLMAFALAVCLFGPMLAFAGDAVACYNINDADARSACLAKARRDVAYCYNVKSASMRAWCMTEAYK